VRDESTVLETEMKRSHPTGIQSATNLKHLFTTRKP
jgi:hypothetical protein